MRQNGLTFVWLGQNKLIERDERQRKVNHETRQHDPAQSGQQILNWRRCERVVRPQLA